MICAYELKKYIKHASASASAANYKEVLSQIVETDKESCHVMNWSQLDKWTNIQAGAAQLREYISSTKRDNTQKKHHKS